MLTKCWLSTITSDQMEGAGSHPAPFTGFMRVASISTIHLLEALRASSLLILHVRLFFARSACGQETTEGSGYRIQGIPAKRADCFPTTVFHPSSFLSFLWVFLLTLPISLCEGHTEIWQTCMMGSSLNHLKVYISGAPIISPGNSWSQTPISQTFHNLNQTVPFVVRFILTSKG